MTHLDENPRQITAGELRRLLERFPDDAPIQVEGCDCNEACIGVSFWGDVVHIRRLHGTHRYDDDYDDVIRPDQDNA